MIKQLTAFAVAAGSLLALASSAAPTSIASPAARTARVLQITDTAKLRYIPPTHGSVLYEEGTAQGTLPGTMRAHCIVGATVRASFTLSTRSGSISGHGSATPHGSGRYESFAGTLIATSGTGRYAHANGHAGFYGTFDRRSYNLVVQTTGSLHY